MSNDDTDILPLRRTKTPDPADGDVKDRYTESQNTHINDDASASSIDIDIEYPSTIYDSQSPSQSYASIDHTKYAHQVQAASPLRFYDGTLSLDQKDQHLQWVEEQGSQNDTTSIGYNLDQPSTVTALNGGINEIVEKPEESSSSAFATGNIDCIFVGFDSTWDGPASVKLPRVGRIHTYVGKLHKAGNGKIGVMLWTYRGKMGGWLREGRELDEIKGYLSFHETQEEVDISIVLTCRWTRKFRWNRANCWDGVCTWKGYYRTKRLYGYNTDVTTADEYSDEENPEEFDW